MTPEPVDPPASTPLEVRWLVRLRWAAIVAQVTSLAGVKYLLGAPFPLPPLVAVVTALACANLVLAWLLARGRTLSPWAITLNLLVDVAALTALLVWTGGAMNPFTTLYLLHVALAAILVPRGYSVTVAAGAVVAFGGLLLARPEAIHVWHSGRMFLLHVRGMWLAFALTAGCLWYFVERVSAALHRREAELTRVRRLASLGTLAAGTAHELRTPLGTVAILASELSELLVHDPTARAQADRIRAEVKRCSEILRRMRAREASGELEEARELVLADSVAGWVAAWTRDGAGRAVRVDVARGAAGARARVRPDAMRQVVHSVLDNARAAVGEDDDGDDAIHVEIDTPNAREIAVRVVDRGAGIPREHLERVGEPFFTTRAPGQGMGLGLFLAEATLAQHGGRLAVRSAPGRGTVIELVLPAA